MQYELFCDAMQWKFGPLHRVFERVVRDSDDAIGPMCLIIDALGMLAERFI